MESPFKLHNRKLKIGKIKYLNDKAKIFYSAKKITCSKNDILNYI